MRFLPLLPVLCLFFALSASAARGSNERVETKEVTIVFAGDVLFDRFLRPVIARYDPFAGVQSVFRGATIAFVNLETPVSTRGEKVVKEFNFRSDPASLTNLTNAGIRVVNNANNHSMDYGPDALMDTLSNLDSYGIMHSGAGSNYAQATVPAVVVTDGISVGFLCYGYTSPDTLYATPRRTGIAGIDTVSIERDIAAARSNVDFLVVSLHWGGEYFDAPGREQVEQAHRWLDAGADIIIGHGPHVLQGAEVYRNKAVFYSIGNFFFDQRRDIKMRYTMIAEARIKKVTAPGGSTGIRQSVSFIPLIMDYGTFMPTVPGEAEGRGLMGHFKPLCAALNTGVSNWGFAAAYTDSFPHYVLF